MHAPLYSAWGSFLGNYPGAEHCTSVLVNDRAAEMKFTLENNASINVIRSYSSEELKIGEHSIRSSCIVMADALIAQWPPATLDELQLHHLEPIFELRPELVLLGTGPRQRFAPAPIRAAFAQQRIGLEAMDLGAACRTFNILVQEDRRVAAALFLK